MAVGFQIEGHSKGRSAEVQAGSSKSRARPNGLVTYQMPFEVENFAPITATAVDGSTNLAIDGTAFAASVVNVHNGIDNVYWTATATSGTWTFNSVTQAFDGTRSIDGSATVNGATAQFDGTTLNPNDYSRFKVRVYISQFNSTGTKALNIQMYDSTNTAVGNPVDILDYISPAIENVWQLADIPLSDFGNLGTDVDRLDIIVVSTQGNPIDFYLDALEFESVGGREFFIRPVNDETTHIHSMEMVFKATDAATRTNDVSPNGFGFGSALPIGVVYKASQATYTPFEYTLTENFDFFRFPGAETGPVIGDGTTAMFKHLLKYDTPVELNPRTGDYLSIRVNDDLSAYGTIYFTASASVLRKPDLTSI